MDAPSAEHIRLELMTRDVEATLAAMADDATVNHVPIRSGGRGTAALRAVAGAQAMVLRTACATSFPVMSLCPLTKSLASRLKNFLGWNA